MVDAGPDSALTLPSSASLDGTVTDDGLPLSSQLTTGWTKVSGPGTVTFGDPAAVDTTASFGKAGTYVLRLTASDGALSSTDDVTVTVQGPANQAPVVDAGPDATVTLPATARPGRHRHRRRPAPEQPADHRLDEGLRAGHRHVRRPGRGRHHRGLRDGRDLHAAPDGERRRVERLRRHHRHGEAPGEPGPGRRRRAGPADHPARHREPGRHRHRRRPAARAPADHRLDQGVRARHRHLRRPRDASTPPPASGPPAPTCCA